MQGPPVPSAGRLFLKRLGFSLFQAAIFGSLVGLLVYYRVPYRTPTGGLEWTQLPSFWLEGWERPLYDWRARELGARTDAQKGRSDRVVAPYG